jgi:hypoxanthine phosphoribosyltransferase
VTTAASKPEPFANNPQALLQHSTLLLDRAQVEAAIDRWSIAVGARLTLLDAAVPIIALVIMRGGMQPAVWLLQRLAQPLVIDSVQVTRYHNRTRGEQLQWRLRPAVSVRDAAVLLIDDIFDEGHTMAAIKDWCLQQGAAQIITTAMVCKQHQRGLPRDWLDLHALTVPDQYVFGCGMDIHGHWRHLPDIHVYQGDTAHD